MWIRQLDIENFRGIESAQVNFGERQTVLVGPNGAGKSTVLEAFALLFGGDRLVRTGWIEFDRAAVDDGDAFDAGAARDVNRRLRGGRLCSIAPDRRRCGGRNLRSVHRLCRAERGGVLNFRCQRRNHVQLDGAWRCALHQQSAL